MKDEEELSREEVQRISQELVQPENLELVFLYQELLGRGLKAWKMKMEL